MDLKPMPVYEDLEVHTEWVHEVADDTLIAYLPGFRKEQIKVQLTTGGNLRIAGERPIGGNKFSRFFKEFPIPSNCDQNKIKANFKGGILHVKHPKLIVPADEKQEKAKPSAEVPIPKPDQKPAEMPQIKQNNGLEQAVQEAPPKATLEKQTGGVAKEADKVSEKAPDKQEENNAANESDMPMEKGKKGWDQEEKSISSSEKREKLADFVQDAAQKENKETEKLDGTYKYQLGVNYKQVLDGLAKGLKNPKKMMNNVLAVLLVVVLAVYLRNAIRSLKNY